MYGVPMRSLALGWLSVADAFLPWRDTPVGSVLIARTWRLAQTAIEEWILRLRLLIIQFENWAEYCFERVAQILRSVSIFARPSSWYDNRRNVLSVNKVFCLGVSMWYDLSSGLRRSIYAAFDLCWNNHSVPSRIIKMPNRYSVSS